MLFQILQKNERWGIFQYIKMPQRTFFWRIKDIFFFEIYWPLEQAQKAREKEAIY